MNSKKLISSITLSCILISSLLCGCKGNGSSSDGSGSSAASSSQAPSSSPSDTTEPTGGSSGSAETSGSETHQATPAELDKDKLIQTGRTQYRAELTIDRPKSMEEFVYVKGTQSITLRNDSNDVWNDVVLREYSPAILESEVWMESREGVTRPYSSKDEQHTAIESVSSDGNELSFAEQEDHTVVKITLDKQMAPGDIRTIDLKFTVRVATGEARQCFDQVDMRTMEDSHDASRIIVALGPILPTVPVYENGKWMADEYFADGECFYTKCSDYNVTVNVPEGFNVVASGQETRIDAKKFEVTASNVRDFALIAGDSLNYVEQQWNGKNIRVWYYDIDNDVYKQAADFALPVSVDAVKTFTEYYGEYAYDELDVVYAPYHNGGMEYPGMVRIQDVMCMMFGEPDISRDAEVVQFLRSDIVHEIAHEWFYSSVSNDQFNEPWLDEGFARFSELVFMEKNGYDKQAKSFLKQIKAEYNDTKHAPVDLAASECSLDLKYGSGKHSYGWTIYEGGAMFLYELRKAMGTEKFEAFMHDWYSSHMNSEVTTLMFFTELFKADDSDAVHNVADKFFRKKSMPQN